MGIAVMADGKRKSAIGNALNKLILRLFGSRILPFDHEVAMAYSVLVSAPRARVQSLTS